MTLTLIRLALAGIRSRLLAATLTILITAAAAASGYPASIAALAKV